MSEMMTTEHVVYKGELPNAAATSASSTAEPSALRREGKESESMADGDRERNVFTRPSCFCVRCRSAREHGP